MNNNAPVSQSTPIRKWLGLGCLGILGIALLCGVFGALLGGDTDDEPSDIQPLVDRPTATQRDSRPAATARTARPTSRPEQVRPTATPRPAQQGNCHASYPGVCIPPAPPDLNCDDVSYGNFRVTGSDPHGFDRDNDGYGCESN